MRHLIGLFSLSLLGLRAGAAAQLTALLQRRGHGGGTGQNAPKIFSPLV